MTIYLRRMGRETWQRMIERAYEPDICPSARKQQFRPDLIRYYLAGGDEGDNLVQGRPFKLPHGEGAPRREKDMKNMSGLRECRECRESQEFGRGRRVYNMSGGTPYNGPLLSYTSKANYNDVPP